MLLLINRLSYAILAAMFLVTSSTWATTTPAATDAKLNPHLELIPHDATGFVHVQLGKLFATPDLDMIRKLLDKAGPTARNVFEKRNVPALSTIETLTLIYVKPQSFTTSLSDGSPDAVTPLVVITTTKPTNRQEIQKTLAPNGRTKTHKGYTYFGSEWTWTAVQFLDGHTFIYGSEDAMYYWLERDTNKTGLQGPLKNAILEANGKHHATIGVRPNQVPRAIIPEEFPTMLPMFNSRSTFTTVGTKIGAAGAAEPAPKKEKWATEPLLKARCLTITADVDKELKVAGCFELGNAKEADAARLSLRQGIDLAVNSLAKRADDHQRDYLRADEAPRPFHSQEIKDDLGTLFELGITRDLRDRLKAAQVEQTGTTVTLKVAPLSQLNLTMAAFGLFQNANMTFTTVGGFVPMAQPADVCLHLKTLAKAFDAYHNKHGHYPAPAIYNAKGEAVLSWRVELLPFLGHEALYQQFKLNEAWDSPHNRKLLTKIPEAYQDPNTYKKHAWQTPFKAIVGKGAAFEGKMGLKRTDFTDGPEQTMLVTEGLQVSWTKPADINAAVLLENWNGNDQPFHAILADCTTRQFQKNLDITVLQALVTRNGRERLSEDPMNLGVFKLEGFK